ncbi:hypothetical protein [Bradyrhizobium sp. NP1]|uniref:hypothetical protein n=1 Tax=Bradyrhizobium sp. NP1 TaxID=3049772 RepID=UPI0025A5EAD8|nr:hypothetical protein [Bradyrhizobium sp. NP1]WJR75208.1 hypothetical protein QOU61_20575 [Bradyrhizobium sp. NP1]
MRPRKSTLAATTLFLAASSFMAADAGTVVPQAAEVHRPLPVRPIVLAGDDEENFDIDLIVGLSGKCPILTIAGQPLGCRAVKYFHGQGGRAYFTIAIDDPTDGAHIVSFSGDKARRDGDRYELSVDQMLLNSKDRPKVNGLRAPLVEPSNGTCKQVGDIERKQITSIACLATDQNGRKYELQFQADDGPVTVQRISQAPLQSIKRRERLKALTACRRKARDAQILRRDSTTYLIQCMEESGQPPTPDDQ